MALQTITKDILTRTSGAALLEYHMIFVLLVVLIKIWLEKMLQLEFMEKWLCHDQEFLLVK